MTQSWDIVIVGGGLAGYVAAAYLSKTNLSITLLEKGKSLGGRARTNKVNQQYFNLGPHALYKKGKAKSILEEIGISLRGKSPKLSGIIVENNTEYTAPFSPLELFTTRLFTTTERMEWVGVLLKIMSTEPERLAEQTFQQWARQVAPSKKVRSLLYTLGRLATYCHAPEKMSAKVAITCLKNAMGGVLYLDGGWMTMINQLHQNAISSGVHVQPHRFVKQMEPSQQGQMKLILSDGEEILGKYVICTTGPHELNEMLSKKIEFPQREFLSHMIPVRGATLDVALTQLPNQKQLFAMDTTKPLYYSVHSNYARLSDDSRNAILHVFKYHHPDEHIDGSTIKYELERFLDKLQPGWQQHVISKRFIPNITVNQRLPQIGDEGMLQSSKTKIPGLYIAGDWASPDSILAEAAISSGKQAAEEITLNERRKNHANHERRLPAI
ncbi:NAD(P)/FAD-dependent oxidoreductase [Neobacillus niacini]|uniref:phytoene desaturase family protein n=1 Tax=Neobacillus niacini TaxID=86668 RepID=UPI001C8CF3A3|nr:FAD-dependent oxidoreductase [Neobacillus niacini]MBY0148087.1 NAD(P)/FAD-dependent oxidoreductase [Neobacillus niacini]